MDEAHPSELNAAGPERDPAPESDSMSGPAPEPAREQERNPDRDFSPETVSNTEPESEPELNAEPEERTVRINPEFEAIGRRRLGKSVDDISADWEATSQRIFENVAGNLISSGIGGLFGWIVGRVVG